MRETLSKSSLEALYRRYNRRDYIHPDPLEFLYGYESLKDREVVGLIASALAYGRVRQILKSVASVLEKMTVSPSDFLIHTSPSGVRSCLSGFRHRFATGAQIAAMLEGMKGVLAEYGGLNACFLAGFCREGGSILGAMGFLVEAIQSRSPEPLGHLLPQPGRGSACKRLHLFLRWMVRRDAVDPGGWQQVPQSQLVVPVDTHMHRIGMRLGFTKRKTADLRTALEITEGFRSLAPEDPVKYDFCLTRLGIRGDVNEASLSWILAGR